MLEKAGVQPQIQRIGKFKSAGDQLSRKDMSEANREMLSALLDDFYGFWTAAVAEARGGRWRGEGGHLRVRREVGIRLGGSMGCPSTERKTSWPLP